MRSQRTRSSAQAGAMSLEAVVVVPLLLVVLLAILQLLLLIDAGARTGAAADAAARSWLSWIDVGGAKQAGRRAHAAAAWWLLPLAPRAPQAAAYAGTLWSAQLAARWRGIPALDDVVRQIGRRTTDLGRAGSSLTGLPVAGRIADALLRLPWLAQQLDVAVCREPGRSDVAERLVRVEVRWRMPLLLPGVAALVADRAAAVREWRPERLRGWPLWQWAPSLRAVIDQTGRLTWPLLRRLPVRTIVRRQRVVWPVPDADARVVPLCVG